MLAQSHGEVAATPSPESLLPPLQVQLPPSLSGFFTESGYTPTTFAEHRTNARLRVRSEAVLTSLYAPPFVKRAGQALRILVKDMSRSGIGILTPHQLWPTERFGVELYSRWIEAEVVRCRKLGDKCFEVGARIRSVSTLVEEQ